MGFIYKKGLANMEEMIERDCRIHNARGGVFGTYSEERKYYHQ